MARSVEEIKSAIKVNIRTYTSLDAFTFPEDGGSSVSFFNIMIFVVSAAMFTFEVIVDNLKSDIQTISNGAISGSHIWLRQQILNFQLGDTITINSTDPTASNYFVPYYAVIDTTKQIITQCVVSDAGDGSVDIKVAQGAPGALTPLSSADLLAVQNYYSGSTYSEGIGFAGVDGNFTSLASDLLYIDADVYFLGQYVESTVKGNLITAIETFLNTFANENFGGNVYMSRLVEAMQAVEGVSRVELSQIKARAAAVAFASASIVNIQGIYTPVSGHIVPETTGGETLTDKLNMISETL